MENKKFLSQANELGPNCGKAIRTETERKNLGVHLPRQTLYSYDWGVLLVIAILAAWVLA